MRSFAILSVVGIAVTIGATSAAIAGGRHHHQHYRTNGYYAEPGYRQGPAYWPPPGQIIRDAAARAETEPGVTNELDPTAHQTATGGPVGGIPGFSGGF